MIRLIASILFSTLLMSILIIGPTWYVIGSVDWPRGWLAVGVMVGTQFVSGLWLLRTDPELLRERSSVESSSLADGLTTALLFLVMFGLLTFAPVDVHRLQILPPPPSGLSLWGGLALFFLGILLTLWTMRENSFGAVTVKIQDERGQRVIDTGPYAYIRHPMYTGFLLIFCGMSLLMESTVTAIAVWPILFLGLLPRIFVEERTLRRDLDGYADYVDRTRARLIPGVF